MPDPGLVLAGTKCGDGMVSAQRVMCFILEVVAAVQHQMSLRHMVESL